MLFAIMATDVPESAALRAATRPKHMDYVGELRDEGRLLLAGPHPAIESPDPGPAGMSGSLIVAEFESADAARDWVEADPYSQAGVFSTVSIKPFLKVFP